MDGNYLGPENWIPYLEAQPIFTGNHGLHEIIALLARIWYPS